MQIVNAGTQKTDTGITYRDIGTQKRVKDAWMWTGEYTKYTDGSKSLNTVKADRLLDFATHYWIDGYTPIVEVTEDDLRAMERELMGFHKGQPRVPDGEFLSLRELPDCPMTGDKSLVGKQAVTREVPEDFIKKIREEYKGE